MIALCEYLISTWKINDILYNCFENYNFGHPKVDNIYIYETYIHKINLMNFLSFYLHFSTTIKGFQRSMDWKNDKFAHSACLIQSYTLFVRH